MPKEVRYIDPVFDQPMAELAKAVPKAPPTPPPQPRYPQRGRPTGDRRSLLDTGLKDFRNVVPDPDESGEDVPVRPIKPVRESYPPPRESYSPPRESYPSARESYPEDLPVARNLDRGRAGILPEPEEEVLEETPPHLLEPAFAVDEEEPIPQRVRAGPAPASDEDFAPPPGRSFGDFIRIGAAVLTILAICGVFAWQLPNMVALYHSLRSSDTPPEVAHETTAAPSSSRKIVDRFDSGAGQTGSQQSEASPTTSPGGSPAAAVAQRVVLYEEDPADPNGKRFVGSAIWRTEMVSPGPGQPSELAVRADVEIPERGMSMTWTLRRNTDPGLPASHTVEIVFKLPPDFPAGGVSNVPGILMKQAEQMRGVPLAGLAVKVTNGFFLIGLSAADADRERNLQLLKERSWFDIPVVYNNNRRAILALEKGTPGERAFAEAFKAWKQ
jgi:hypothetical protein